MKRSLLLLGILVAFALLVLGVVLIRNRLIAAAQRDLAIRAQFTSDALDHTLQLRMIETFTFAALPSLRGFAAADDLDRPARAVVAQAEIQSIAAADPNVRAVAVTDSSGRVILATDGSMNAHWSERVYVREALAGHLYASAPSRDLGEISHYCAAPLLDNAGEIAGALVVRISAQDMWNVLASQSDTLVVDENGVRIADRSGAPQTFVALAPITPTLSARLIAEKHYGADVTQIRATALTELASVVGHSREAPFAYHDPNGQTVYAAARTMVTNPWTVIVFQNEDAMLMPLRDLMWDETRVGVPVLVLAAGAGAIVLRRGRHAATHS